MNENTPQRIITLKDIWELFVRRIVVVVLIAALAAGLYYGWNKMTGSIPMPAPLWRHTTSTLLP